MDAIEAIAAEIIAGRIAYRPARVLLALALSGRVMGARQIAEQTGIDRANVLRALAVLEADGWIERDKKGARLAPEAVDKRVPNRHTCAESTHAESVPNRHTCVPKEHTQSAQKTRMCAESTHATGEEKPAPILGKPELSTWHDSCCISSCSSSFIKTTTTTTTTEEPKRVPNRHTPPLDWPQCLHEALRDKAAAILDGIGAEEAQALLDELAGRAALHPIANPLAYLHRLVSRARAGEFVAVAGVSIAEGRRRQAEMRKRLEEQRAALTREAAGAGVRHAAT